VWPWPAEPHGGSLMAKGVGDGLPGRAPSVRYTAGGFRPTANTAAWRQPAGKGPCHRPTHAFGSAGTFGAERRRGLPPNR